MEPDMDRRFIQMEEMLISVELFKMMKELDLRKAVG